MQNLASSTRHEKSKTARHRPPRRGGAAWSLAETGGHRVGNVATRRRTRQGLRAGVEHRLNLLALLDPHEDLLAVLPDRHFPVPAGSQPQAVRPELAPCPAGVDVEVVAKDPNKELHPTS